VLGRPVSHGKVNDCILTGLHNLWVKDAVIQVDRMSELPDISHWKAG
jgi:hypothetical protein